VIIFCLGGVTDHHIFLYYSNCSLIDENYIKRSKRRERRERREERREERSERIEKNRDS
jgi:hypothetical protein